MFFSSITLAIVLVSSRTLAKEFLPNDAPYGNRVPMGFQGIRGQKHLRSSQNQDFMKRAPMGFQGMRGKKDFGTDIRVNVIALDEESEKRSPMGFQGMRGKKDLRRPLVADFNFRDEYFKPASMGLQRMRGKKAIPCNNSYNRACTKFYATRGKKSILK